MTMLNRIARSISRNLTGTGDNWRDYEDTAREVLDDMREPTQRMVGEANRLNHPRDVDVWRTMVGAALAEGEAE